jgi:hypothetical protein
MLWVKRRRRGRRRRTKLMEKTGRLTLERGRMGLPKPTRVDKDTTIVETVNTPMEHHPMGKLGWRICLARHSEPLLVYRRRMVCQRAKCSFHGKTIVTCGEMGLPFYPFEHSCKRLFTKELWRHIVDSLTGTVSLTQLVENLGRLQR